jgi:ubiquinone/menaquinone biosynthesis C-methylase UbiE
MPFESDNLVRANRRQTGSEKDTFTIERYRQFAKYLPDRAERVLDVGGGVGEGGRELKRLRSGLSLVGLDCVPERIEAMDMGVYAEKACAFADNLPFPDGSFDAIVAGEFIEHVPGASVDATLHEFFRVLRLRGSLLLTTPNPYYVRNKLQGLSVITEPAHVSQHYPETLELRLKMAGFSRIWIKGSGKVTRYLGESLPLRLYGSFLCSALKW